MKTDIDSILYIVITIAILIVSALGSRKKKRLEQMNAQESSASAERSPERDDEAPLFNPQPSVNPLQRIEQLLSGHMPQYESMEGESLEETLDEEEQIMADIQKSREEPWLSAQEEMKKTEAIYGDEEEIIETTNEGNQQVTPGTMHLRSASGRGLFAGINEIKRAVIYAEILNRKYN